MVCAPLNAALSASISSTSPFTISMPLAIKALLSGFVGSRVMPLILYSGSFRNFLATDPP
jgi:hypothetical protein